MYSALALQPRGVIYPLLFHMKASSYLLYLGTGLIGRQLLSGTINERCRPQNSRYVMGVPRQLAASSSRHP
jgi:hypothetical protein